MVFKDVNTMYLNIFIMYFKNTQISSALISWLKSGHIEKNAVVWKIQVILVYAIVCGHSLVDKNVYICSNSFGHQSSLTAKHCGIRDL